MRISSKGSYAIAALMELAASDKNEPMAVSAIASRLEISKVYLEQVFSILKRSGIIVSTKGAQGGYTLHTTPDKITMYDILSPMEYTLFDAAEKSLENIPAEHRGIISKLVFVPLDEAIHAALKSVTLAELIRERASGDMYFI
jgi:Rrf2 family protein